MELRGYVAFNVTPWEAASGGKGVECPSESESCTATFHSRVLRDATTSTSVTSTN